MEKSLKHTSIQGLLLFSMILLASSVVHAHIPSMPTCLDAKITARITEAVKNPNLLPRLEEEFTLARLNAALAKLNGLAKGLGIKQVKDPLMEKANFYAFLLDQLADALMAGIPAAIDAAKQQGAQDQGAQDHGAQEEDAQGAQEQGTQEDGA